MIFINRLKKLLAERNITNKELCDKIGMTEGGFYQSIKNNSFKVATYELISEVLNVPMTYWFMEENPVAEGFHDDVKFQLQTITYLQEKVVDLNEKIELLKKLLADKEEQIEQLKNRE